MSQLISVVITTHNRVELLKKAIVSVKNQSYNNFECFIVDDASNIDINSEICDLLDDRFKLIQIPKEESGGSNYARNLGIKKSKGEYIALLDDDDTWHEKKLEEQLKVIKENPESKICYCLRTLIYSNGYRQNEEFIKSLEGDCSRKIFYNYIGTTSTFLIESQLLKKELFDEKLNLWQDYELMMRLCQITNVCCAKNNLVNYSINIDDNNRKSNKYSEWLKSLKYIDDKLEMYHQGLTSKEIKLKNLLQYRDACDRINWKLNKCEVKKYTLEMYKINKDYKLIIKYLLGMDKRKCIAVKKILRR